MHGFKTIIPKFDAFLDTRGLKLEATIIGGAALQLLGVITRTTKDCDVLEPKLSNEILGAAGDFAASNGLAGGWLNNGPATLIDELPAGWKERRKEIFKGKALFLLTLGREDTLRAKLYAYLDRGIDLDDLKELKPTKEEIEKLSPWLKDRDGNPGWPDYVDKSMTELIRILDGTA